VIRYLREGRYRLLRAGERGVLALAGALRNLLPLREEDDLLATDAFEEARTRSSIAWFEECHVYFLYTTYGRLLGSSVQLFVDFRVDEPRVLAAFGAVRKELALDEPEKCPAEDALVNACLWNRVSWSEEHHGLLKFTSVCGVFTELGG